MQEIKTFLIQQTKFKITAERIGERLDIEAPRGARLSIVANMSGIGFHLLNEGSRQNLIPAAESEIIAMIREFIQATPYLTIKNAKA